MEGFCPFYNAFSDTVLALGRIFAEMNKAGSPLRFKSHCSPAVASWVRHPSHSDVLDYSYGKIQNRIHVQRMYASTWPTYLELSEVFWHFFDIQDGGTNACGTLSGKGRTYPPRCCPRKGG